MLSAIVFAVLATSANAYYPKTEVQRVLLAKWNPRNTYEALKICQIAEQGPYGYDDTFGSKLLGYDTPFDIFTKNRETRQIRHCCNKNSPYETKECLKDVRENVLDNYCKKTQNHVCCKNEYENRYTCFARTPLSDIDDVFSSPLMSPLTSPLTSPLLESIADVTDVADIGVGCGRRCRQQIRNDRYLKNRLAVDALASGIDTDFDLNSPEDEALFGVSPAYTYLEAVQDSDMGVGGFGPFAGPYSLRREILEEAADEELYPQSRIGRLTWRFYLENQAILFQSQKWLEK